MILPSMGVISEIIAAFARKPVFGYKFVAFASMGIAVIGFIVWGHHLFVSSQSLYAGMMFSILTMLVAVPSAVKVFNWMATLYRGLDRVLDADVLRSRFHRPVHHRRLDRPDAGHHRHRRARPRHLLRGRPLPLHHGGRGADGLPRRPCTTGGRRSPAGCTRVLVTPLGGDHLPGLQPDFLPAVHPRLSRDAAALPRLSGRIPGSAHPVDRRCLDPGGGLRHPLVYFIWSLKYGEIAAGQPLGRRRPRMADHARRRRCTTSKRSRRSISSPTSTSTRSRSSGLIVIQGPRHKGRRSRSVSETRPA